RDEKESDEKLADNLQKLSESHVPSKGPVEPKANSKGERCKVKFDNYGNEEEQDQSALLPEAAAQPRREKRVWRLGYRCRAVYSEDGLVYPAVLVWMRDERCRAVDGFRSTGNNSTDWKRKGREWRTPQEEGREELSSPKFPPGKDYGKSCYDFGKEHGDKKKPNGRREEPSGRREEPNNHPFSFFPPVPPPKGSLVRLFAVTSCHSCLLLLHLHRVYGPRRAVLTDTGDELDSAVTDLSSMLLSWYLCGYHTGCYMVGLRPKNGEEEERTILLKQDKSSKD
ncbi:unnamed protein product, partial [Coregonus sp. 'balchen']